MKRSAKEILEELYSHQQDDVLWIKEEVAIKYAAIFEAGGLQPYHFDKVPKEDYTKDWYWAYDDHGFGLWNNQTKCGVFFQEQCEDHPIWNTIKLLQMLKDGSTDEEVLLAKLEME